MDLPEAVLLDLDGTLLDSEPLWLMAEQRLMDSYGLPWTQEDQQACLGGPLGRVGHYMYSRVNSADGYISPDAPSSPKVIVTELLEIVLGLFKTVPISWRPGARDLVTNAHELGVPTCIVTASWRVLLDVVIEEMSQQVGNFSASIAGDEVAHSKPDPTPYITAAQLLGIEIKQALAIEDSPTGVASAVSAGARTIAVEHIAPITNRGAHVLRSLEGHTIESLWSATKI